MYDSIPTFPSSRALASTGEGVQGRSLNKELSAPLHMQMADYLREKIYSRAWGSGMRIPSEHELMERFDISRGTVRRAIKTLVTEGLLIQEHGRGTFVSEPGISHPAGVRAFSFAESLHNQGKDFVTHILNQFVVPASLDVARELGVSEGMDVLFLRRVRTVGDEPFICQEGWFNLQACPGLEKVDFTRKSAFDAVQETSGRRIAFSRISYTARVAGKEHGDYLGVDEAAPVLMLEQIIRLEDERVIEWNHTWLKAGQSVVGDAVQPH